MKKILLLILLALCAVASYGQSAGWVKVRDYKGIRDMVYVNITPNCFSEVILTLEDPFTGDVLYEVHHIDRDSDVSLVMIDITGYDVIAVSVRDKDSGELKMAKEMGKSP